MQKTSLFGNLVIKLKFKGGPGRKSRALTNFWRTKAPGFPNGSLFSRRTAGGRGEEATPVALDDCTEGPARERLKCVGVCETPVFWSIVISLLPVVVFPADHSLSAANGTAKLPGAGKASSSGKTRKNFAGLKKNYCELRQQAPIQRNGIRTGRISKNNPVNSQKASKIFRSDSNQNYFCLLPNSWGEN